MVMMLIKKELDRYSADRLGKFDFALHSAGKVTFYRFIGDGGFYFFTFLLQRSICICTP